MRMPNVCKISVNLVFRVTIVAPNSAAAAKSDPVFISTIRK